MFLACKVGDLADVVAIIKHEMGLNKYVLRELT